MAIVPVCREKYYEKLMEKMREKPVFIVSSNTCPYCEKAKNLLDSNGVESNEFNLDNLNEEDRLEYGHCIYGGMARRFVPFVYINQKPFGSYSELIQARDNGYLKQLASGKGDDIL